MDEQTSTKRLQGRRILIVDDDADVLAVVKQALQSEGALTQCCSDGNTAVSICDSDPPDVLVLDMMLPKRSGFLVLERVKTQPKPPVVIMVTANEGKRHQAYAETLGVDAYMHKPLRLEKLIVTAVDLLDEREEQSNA
ncbi:MAG: response regulator [Planctomycetes bacterium]|nr:response regulator [Planctomycetota bacterium]